MQELHTVREKENTAQILLQDKEVQKLLGEMILEKANGYDKLKDGSLTLTEEEMKKLLMDGGYTNINRIFLHFEALDEAEDIMRDLTRMCYEYNRSKTCKLTETDWERAYKHATEAVDILSVVRYLLPQENCNKNIRCPFHEDKSPSLKIYSKNNYFVCFGCGARGSAIDFVMKFNNCSFKEAVQFLYNF